MQPRADDHDDLRAELAVLNRERTRLATEPALMAEHEAYSARLAEFYIRLEIHLLQLDHDRRQRVARGVVSVKS
jgi:hypothetical protein